MSCVLEFTNQNCSTSTSENKHYFKRTSTNALWIRTCRQNCWQAADARQPLHMHSPDGSTSV